jgi:hypothetical protein
MAGRTGQGMRCVVTVEVNFSARWLRGYCKGTGRHYRNVKADLNKSLGSFIHSIKTNCNYPDHAEVRLRIVWWDNCQDNCWHTRDITVVQVTAEQRRFGGGGSVTWLSVKPTWLAIGKIKKGVRQVVHDVLEID